MSRLSSPVHQPLTEYFVDAAKKGKVCPVVGAGASSEVDVPTWNRLIEQLGNKLSVGVPPDANPIQAVDILMAALQRRSGGSKLSREQAECSFVGQLRDVLYAPTVNWTRGDNFMTRAPTLLALLALCVARASPNRTFHVITYNFDCLIEEAIAALGHRAIAVTASQPDPSQGIVFEPETRRSHPVLAESDIRDLLTVRVAHPHGLIRRSSAAYQPRTAKVVLNDLILSSASYQRGGRSPFNIHNIWQIAAFSSLVCLFYGWSFNDAAVQNIIDIGKEIRQHGGESRETVHLALMKRSTSSEEYLAGEQSHFQAQGIFRFLTTDFDDQKTFLVHLLRELGVSTREPVRKKRS